MLEKFGRGADGEDERKKEHRENEVCFGQKLDAAVEARSGREGRKRADPEDEGHLQTRARRNAEEVAEA